MNTSTSSPNLGRRVHDLLSIGYTSSQITVLLDCTAEQALDAMALRAVHHCDLIESGTTDECSFCCKIFRCSCGESEVRHMGSYGCPIGRGVSV